MQLHWVTIYSGDLDAAREYYERKLGWQVTYDDVVNGERWLSLVPPGGQCNLGISPGGAGRKVGGSTGIGLRVSDMDATYAELTERGALFAEPPEAKYGTKVAVLTDPDGHLFHVVELSAS